MKTVYGTGRVCPMANKQCNLKTEGLSLDPGLKEIIGKPTKHTYEELSYVWEGWRNATGKVMKDDFKEYVGISNEVAEANGKSLSLLYIIQLTSLKALALNWISIIIIYLCE